MTMAVAAGLLFLAAAPGSQDASPGLADLAAAGLVEDVRRLLAEGTPDLEATDEGGWTPLMHAVEGGHDEIVALLLGAGADPERRNAAGETPLHRAARGGREASARLLLEAGADFKLQDNEGRTPLYRAIERRRADVIELLQLAAQAEGKGAISQAPFGSLAPAAPPRIVESVPAPYTQAARAAGVEGTVVLMVLVRRDGSVGAANVSRGLEPSLDESARRAVRQWKFAPAMRDGRTIDVVLEVEVSFQLPGRS